MFFWVLFIIFVPFVNGFKYPCSANVTISLELNEIAYFESLNYPNFDYDECLLNFSLQEPKHNHKLFIAFDFATQENGKIFKIEDKIFSLQDMPKKKAFHGLISHEDVTKGCPLEALSNPLIIHNEAEIIFLRSTYNENEKRIRPCIWQFKTNKDYGFKVVIEVLNVSTSTELTIENSTEAFLAKEIAMLYHPYYNKDNYIQIKLSLDNSSPNTTFIPKMEFQAYISIIKNQYRSNEIFCSRKGISYIEVGWTSNTSQGYDNNIQCEVYCNITLNYAMLIHVNKYYVEKGVDYVHYFTNGENDTKIENEGNFFIEGTLDLPRKYVYFQFITDGSVQGAGFEMAFTVYDTINERKILSINESFFVIDNSVHDIFEITHNLPPTQKLTFILYTSFDDSSVQIYNNKSLKINYSHKNCFAYPNQYKCVLSYPSFVVSFRNFFGFSNYTFLAIRLSSKTKICINVTCKKRFLEPSKGCIFEENIFIAKKTDENLSIVGISNFEGKCILKLLIATGMQFYISDLWTTSVQENVKIYVGIDTSQLLFEFNANSMRTFSHVTLFSSIYSIYIPSNSTFFMVLKRLNSLTLNILEHPFRSIIATPNFNIFHNSYVLYNLDMFYSFNIVANISLKFTVIYYKMFGQINRFFFMVNQENFLVDRPGSIFTFSNQTVYLYYTRLEEVPDNFSGSEGALLYVESFKD